MKLRALFFVALCVLVYGPASPVQAADWRAGRDFNSSSPLLEQVALRCVRLIRRGNDETLVNTCGNCQIVGVTRKRTGVPIPIVRSFSIQDGTTFSLPFRGPGNSRITSMHSCQDEAADARDSDKIKTAADSCLELKQATRGKVMLVNGCGSCRAAAIQRMDRSGRILNRQAFKLSPNDATAVVSQGAAKVSIIADFACPS